VDPIEMNENPLKFVGHLEFKRQNIEPLPIRYQFGNSFTSWRKNIRQFLSISCTNLDPLQKKKQLPATFIPVDF